LVCRPDEACYGNSAHSGLQNPEFDQEVQTRFLKDYEQAIVGQLDHWKNSPKSCLALILLLDQFPRNMFRGTAQAFAADPLSAAQHAITNGFDKELLTVRWFIYLPLSTVKTLIINASQSSCS